MRFSDLKDDRPPERPKKPRSKFEPPEKVPPPPPPPPAPAPAAKPAPGPASFFSGLSGPSKVPPVAGPFPVKRPLPPAPAPAPAAAAGKVPLPMRTAEGVVSLEFQRRAAQDVYGAAILAMKALMRDIALGPVDSYDGLRALVHQIREQLRTGEGALMMLTTRSTASHYLYAHAVNVCILSMDLALGLGWSDDQLEILGLSALLMDIGLTKFLKLADLPRALTPEEFQEIQLHPMESRKMLDHLHGIEESAKQTISEIIAHEGARKSRPGGFKDAHAAAEIICLCDIYEAMSHHRAWRAALLPHDAVKTMLKQNSQQFDRKLLQAFVERLSLYPPGSYVEITGGEIAWVLAANPKTPTLPTVEVRLRADGTVKSPPNSINLSQQPLIHIERAVDETKLHLSDKRLLLAFQANRWWVE